MEKQSRWRILVQKDGVRRAFYSSAPGRKGQRECNDKADLWLDGNLLAPDNRCQKLFDSWLEELKLTTSVSHWRPCQTHWNNWIKPAIGRLKIGDINEHHLQMIINKAHAAGKSKKYLHNIRAGMTAFIKYCRRCKATTLIVENITIPRGAPEGHRTVLQPIEIITLLTSDKTVWRGKEVTDLFVNAYRFEVTTGLRPGEVVGLKWSDVLDDGSISLKRSINIYNETTKGKNDNAQRTFALKPIDLDILNKQRNMLLQTGVRSEYVFPQSNGQHIRQQTYYRHWLKYRDFHGISKATPYELRHTFVTVVKELPESLIKPLVGHSVDMDTYGTYAHQVNGELERTARLIQDTFSKLIEENKKKTELA
ncbi:MAG: tyrosine-type recombinase/integrase [Oscillospiraceae bacterium]